MNETKLVSMANQISIFFKSYSDEEAMTGIREHIRAFWTPKMRDWLREQTEESGLDPLVAESMRRWPKDAVLPEGPIKEQAGRPGMAGVMASDAG